MASSISFTDGIGAATLTNGKTPPFDIFDNWTPFDPFNGVPAHELGSKRRHTFEFGTIYGARFQLSKIPNTSQDVAVRLIRHLLRGGTCAVATGDSASRTYATCTMMEGEEPTLELSDRQMLEYTMSFALINTADSPSDLLCIY